MDPLSEILKSMKMRHTRVGTLKFSAPWALAVEGFELPAVYAVAGGQSCWLRLPRRELIALHKGDVILVMGRHELLSAPDVPLYNMHDMFKAHGYFEESIHQEPSAPMHLQWGGGGEPTQLIGLAFDLIGSQRNPLITSLPHFILLRSESKQFPWIDAAMDFLTSEHAGSAGYTAMARLVSELIFINILRFHLLDESPATRGWLKGLTDPLIAKALRAMHEAPGEQWTVGSLASQANMSRTAFAVRFAALVEVAPIEYLTRWRMHLAAERILSNRPNLTQLAFDLGYTSDAAFRSTFKLHYGVPPSRYGQEEAGGEQG